MAGIASVPVAMLRLSPSRAAPYGFPVVGCMVSFTTFGPLATSRAGIGFVVSLTHAVEASHTELTFIIDVVGSAACTDNVGFLRRLQLVGTAIVCMGASSNATATIFSRDLTYVSLMEALDGTRFPVNVCHLATIMDGRPTPSASDRDGFADLRRV